MSWLSPDNYTEYSYQMFLCFLFILFVDKLLAPVNARWFFIHICVNTVVTISSMYDVLVCLTNPLICMTNDWSNSVAYMIAATSHTYHVVAFNNLKYTDYLHHITMGPVAGTLAFIYLRKSGTNMALFGLTGVPGGIDYIMLTLVKMGKMNYITEKKWNVFIHVWIRMPFLLIGSGIMFESVICSTTVSVPAIICLLLVVWNGVYYMHDTLFNYYTKHY